MASKSRSNSPKKVTESDKKAIQESSQKMQNSTPLRNNVHASGHKTIDPAEKNDSNLISRNGSMPHNKTELA